MPEWGAVSTLHRGKDDVLSNCLPTPVLPSGPPPAWTLDHLGIQSEIWGMISSWDQYNVACKAYATTRWIKLKMESKTLGDAPVLMFTRLCRRRLLWTRPNGSHITGDVTFYFPSFWFILAFNFIQTAELYMYKTKQNKIRFKESKKYLSFQFICFEPFFQDTLW